MPPKDHAMGEDAAGPSPGVDGTGAPRPPTADEASVEADGHPTAARLLRSRPPRRTATSRTATPPLPSPPTSPHGHTRASTTPTTMTPKDDAMDEDAAGPSSDVDGAGVPGPPTTRETWVETDEPPAKKQKESPVATPVLFPTSTPAGLPVADAQEEDEDDDLSTSTRKSPSRPPSTWAERLNPLFLSAEEAEADLDRGIAADLQGSLASISVRFERSPEYAVATIASGSANEITLLHSVTGMTDEATGESTGLVALLGMGKVASIFRLHPRKTFAKRHNVQVLKPAVILRNDSLDEVPATSESGEENTEHVSIICSFQSPPWLTKEIHARKLSRAADVLNVVRTKALETIAARAKQDGSSTDALITLLEDEDAIPFSFLLRHLYEFSTLERAVPSCLSLETSLDAQELHEELHASLVTNPDFSSTISRLERRRSSLSGIAASLAREQNQKDNHEKQEEEHRQQLLQLQRQQLVQQEELRRRQELVQQQIHHQQVLQQPPQQQQQRQQQQPSPQFPLPPPPQVSFSGDQNIARLVTCVDGLAKMQESALNLQTRIHQSRQDGLQSIHYTVEHFIRRVGSPDGQVMARALPPLARAMLSTKKKDVAHDLFMLELNAKGVRCEITPALNDALFSGALASRSSLDVPNLSSFGCATTMTGTRLEDLDITLALRQDDKDKDLSTKERDAIYGNHVLICTTSSQLTKVLHIQASILESYVGANSLIAIWYRDWANFVKEEEDFLAMATRNTDPDLPPKIQSLIEGTVHDYITEGRFYVPSDDILDTDDIKKAIKRRYCPYELLPAVQAILHPPPSSGRKKPSDPTPPSNAGRGGDKKGAAKHQDKDLKNSHNFFRQVIQKHGLFLKNVPNPVFNDKSEECSKFVFTGQCSAPNCKRGASHSPPTGARKTNLLSFRAECLERYNAAKGPSDPDFQ
jgi:hypothetical protein